MFCVITWFVERVEYDEGATKKYKKAGQSTQERRKRSDPEMKKKKKIMDRPPFQSAKNNYNKQQPTSKNKLKQD